jgi:predicted enzyme related to lactoylglutathione lyase
MPRRDAAPAGAPCWVDLMSTDTAKSQAFYGALFGWTFEEANQEFGGYINIQKDGVRVAGLMPNHGGAPVDVWSVYLATDDAEKTTELATSRGAQVMAPPMAVGPLGTMAILVDPGLAVIGMWQPGEHKGSGIIAETGAPSWFELQTRDYDKVVPFYKDVFGWDTNTVSDAPEFRYTTMIADDTPQAGIMDASAFLPEDVPAHWAVYFGTDDTDASLEKVRKLGGQVVQPAEDTPYGRLASAFDSTGALFKLVQGMQV